MTRRTDPFSPELLQLLRLHLLQDDPVRTLSNGKPNWVISIEADGLQVETERSRASGDGPQFVPAWMLEVAWERLTTQGTLTNSELLDTDDLNVKRSSFVCAALACLPRVTATSLRSITLTYEP